MIRSVSPGPTSTAPDAVADVDAHEVERTRDTSAPIRLGFWVLVVGFGLFLAWAAWVPLDEGVPAPATVAVEGRRTTIQHLQGGVVKAVHVRDGDEVAVGDLLIELDDAATRATREAVRQNYLGQRALEGRLLAELSGARTIAFHPDVLESNDPQAAQHMAVQRQLFDARRTARDAEVAALEQLVAGLESQITGAQQTLRDRRSQQALQSEQLASVRRLADEGFAPRNQALQLEQAQAELRASAATLETELLRVRSAAAENRLRLAALRQQYTKEASSLLADVQREVQANQERLVAAEHELARMRITSPAAGQVIGLAIRNPGGIVQHGQPLMDILPLGVPLVLDVRIPPHVIDSVAPGQEVEVRFAAFASTPHLVVLGRLVAVSGDVLSEPTPSGPQPYYAGRAELTPEGMRALAGRTVQPGMAAEVLIRTGERSMLAYLLGPLARRVSAAMTER
ncbi:MAG: HlyD family type I secretion periplasmic adaptor subunit [Burkholderiales bacterium]|nr:HlyD family type I secretion periplasmic adaptor subunit [Burkholderiales bacterium]